GASGVLQVGIRALSADRPALVRAIQPAAREPACGRASGAGGGIGRVWIGSPPGVREGSACGKLAHSQTIAAAGMRVAHRSPRERLTLTDVIPSTAVSDAIHVSVSGKRTTIAVRDWPSKEA